MVVPHYLQFLRNHVYLYYTLLLLIHYVLPQEYINKIAVHIPGGHLVAERVAREAGLHNKGQIGNLQDHFLFEIPHRHIRSASHSQEHHDFLTSHPEVHWFQQQVAKSRQKRDFNSVNEQSLPINDPYFPQQWYLHGGGQGSYDMNVINVWKKGYTGKGVVVTILDDGIEWDHPDLGKNYDPHASYDVNDNDNDPMPRYESTNENRHGTRCAGEVSATANNSQCIVGIAYDSRIGGVRMLDGDVYDAVEAASLSFNRSHIDIYSASWGPDDDGRVVDGPGPLAKKAFETGIKEGRGGKGSIFVWASGNGGSAQDSCNCDGYANSIYTLSISSTSERGTKPWYLEECSSTLATTYSSGAYNEKQIVSVDLHKLCTVSHTGTSASAPLAAGMIALILEANPNLTWRDVQYITLMSARPQPMVDGQWITNALGRKVSLRYGYGLMDGERMVDLALQWQNVPEKHICSVPGTESNLQLQGEQLITTVSTDCCAGLPTEVRFLEHVQCQITLNYRRRGNIVLYLTSPRGTRSTILPHRPNDLSNNGFVEWPFLSVHFWGEDPRGQWSLEVEDGNPDSGYLRGGTLVSWTLILHGTKEQPVQLKGTTQTSTISQKATSAWVNATTTTTTARPTIPRHDCHLECAGDCNGKGPENCLACKHYFNPINRTCVEFCPAHTYAQEQSCKPCDSSCRTCSGPTLAQCLSCEEGVRFHPKHGTCYMECLEGTFSVGHHCQPCHNSCKSCFGKEKNECTSCLDGVGLNRGECNQAKPVWSHVDLIVPNLVLVLVLISLLLFVIFGILLFYIYQQRKLCWSYKYDKLAYQDGDGEGQVVKAYFDEDSEDENYHT